MKRVLFAAVLFAAVTALLSGCARDVIVEEALQLPAHARIFTAYNLWYDEDGEIRSINTQQGSILPFGTEVTILSATEDKIRFRTVADHKDYVIVYEKGYRMMTPEDYIREVFTRDDPETLTEGIPVTDVEKLKRGIVEKGMSKQEVRLAYGRPCKFKTPDEALDTWLYWTDFLVGRRVVFNNDKVFEIIEL